MGEISNKIYGSEIVPKVVERSQLIDTMLELAETETVMPIILSAKVTERYKTFTDLVEHAELPVGVDNMLDVNPYNEVPDVAVTIDDKKPEVADGELELVDDGVKEPQHQSPSVQERSTVSTGDRVFKISRF